MPSIGFENPNKYKWIDKFKDSGKDVSITSLECIHACSPPNRVRTTPTILFYERQLDTTEVEPEMKWVFDFEYVAPESKLDAHSQYQYVQNSSAAMYQHDKVSLDSYLMSLPHVKWSKYEAHYEKGGAVITGKAGKRSFGVGWGPCGV